MVGYVIILFLVKLNVKFCLILQNMLLGNAEWGTVFKLRGVSGIYRALFNCHIN